MRVPHRKTYKMTVMTSSKQKFEKMKKVSSQIFVKIICVHFHQNRTKIVEIKDPDRHTHTRTYRQGSSWDNIFSPEMTEYKNQENLMTSQTLYFETFGLKLWSRMHILLKNTIMTVIFNGNNGQIQKPWIHS